MALCLPSLVCQALINDVRVTGNVAVSVSVAVHAWPHSQSQSQCSGRGGSKLLREVGYGGVIDRNSESGDQMLEGKRNGKKERIEGKGGAGPTTS